MEHSFLFIGTSFWLLFTDIIILFLLLFTDIIILFLLLFTGTSCNWGSQKSY